MEGQRNRHALGRTECEYIVRSLAAHAFLFSLGGGRFRLWDPATDGNWVVGPDGVHLADDDGNALEIAADEAESEASNIEATISLERDMEANLVTNLHQLEPGMVLRDQQLDTGIVGRLDLLATDKDGQYVVIELKVGKADDRAVAQTMRYMGWVQHERASGKPVRGILIAREFSDGAKFAALPSRSSF